LEEGLASLLNTLYSCPQRKEVSRRRANASLYNLPLPPLMIGAYLSRGVKERLCLSCITTSPFPLIRERGTKGDGVVNFFRNKP